MKLETYLDAMCIAWKERLNDQGHSNMRRTRQYFKFRQQVLRYEDNQSYTNGYLAALKNSLHEHLDPGWEQRTRTIIREFDVDAPSG